MALSDLQVKGFYTGNGVLTDYQIPFPLIKTEAELKLYLTGPDGIAVLQTEGIEFSLFGAATVYDFNTTVRFVIAPPSGYSIAFFRELILDQELDATANGSFRQTDHETAYDRMTAMIQQTNEILSRAVVFKKNKINAFQVSLPESEPGKALLWSPDGLSFINSDVDLGTLQASIADALAGALAAQAAAESAQATATAASATASAAAAAALAAQTAAEDTLVEIDALIDAILSQDAYTFTNNQGATNLAGQTFDSAVYESLELTISVVRGTARYIIKKFLIFNGTTWDLIDGASYSNDAPAHGLTFTISGTTTAQLKLASDNGGLGGTVKIKKNLFTI